MVEEKNELDELSREIKKVIADNKKFLDRVLDEEFEPDEEVDEEEAGTIEEL
jgi:hypothetical protein